MTNAEKYKTAHERLDAYKKWCITKQKQRCCDCPVSPFDGGCSFRWLELEAEDELQPCWFCGNKCELREDGDSDRKYYVRCSLCKYESCHGNSKENVVACHNSLRENINGKTK